MGDLSVYRQPGLVVSSLESVCVQILALPPLWARLGNLFSLSVSWFPPF